MLAKFGRRKAALLAAVTCVAAGGVYWLTRTGAPPPSLPESIAAIEDAREDAITSACEAARNDWDRSLPSLMALFASGRWQGRAAACRMAASASAQHAAGVAGHLVACASDSDWRVRLAAFDALARLHPLRGPVPLMNTPLDEREELLLAWIDDYDSAAGASLRRDLCGIYALAPHAEFGRPLTGRCLTCHAGTPPRDFSANASCMNCHADVHGDWTASAHAQSLSHLRLATIDSRTRKPAQVDFGPVHGISCGQCHALKPEWREASTAASPTSQSRPAGPVPDVCPATMPGHARADASQSCLACHGQTWAQWQAWRSAPHPRRLDWPPGQIDPAATDDSRGCVDCHMPSLPRPGGRRPFKAHLWQERRDPHFLAQALDMTLEVGPIMDGRRSVTVILTNLAGHACPAGTVRRAIVLTAGEDDKAPVPLAVLGGPRDGTPDVLHQLGGSSPAGSPSPAWPPNQPPLTAGESRRLTLSVGAATARLVCRAVYLRNITDGGAYSVEFIVASWPLDKSAPPADLREGAR
ncbi:MAG: multiheme c-type cytochrome [Phycisphaerae bacterium]